MLKTNIYIIDFRIDFVLKNHISYFLNLKTKVIL